MASDLHGIHNLAVEGKPLESVIDDLVFVVSNQTCQAIAGCVRIFGRFEIEMHLTALQIGDLGIELLINANGSIYAVGSDELGDYVFCYVFSNFQVAAIEQGFAECLCIAMW